MVTHGARDAEWNFNTDTLQTKSRLQLLFHTCRTQQETLRVRRVLTCWLNSKTNCQRSFDSFNCHSKNRPPVMSHLNLTNLHSYLGCYNYCTATCWAGGETRGFKGKYVNGKTAGQMIKIKEFPGENGRVDRYEYDQGVRLCFWRPCVVKWPYYIKTKTLSSLKKAPSKYWSASAPIWILLDWHTRFITSWISLICLRLSITTVSDHTKLLYQSVDISAVLSYVLKWNKCIVCLFLFFGTVTYFSLIKGRKGGKVI